jgi:phospho-N-acetylmuramoyl-pentapeptide-transferase
MKGPLWLTALAFLLMVPWGGRVVRALLERGIGKHIRTDGPASHQVKSGTATMGGLYFLVGISIVTLGLALWGYAEALVPLAVMLGYGFLGAVDDLKGLQDTAGVGWLARSKFPWQWALAAALALLLFVTRSTHPLILPVTGQIVEMGWWFLPIAVVLIVAFSNGMNLHDGLDGLAGGTSAIAYAAYGVLAWVAGQPGLALFCFALVGLLLAFLWYNVHPARMFMGDVGSEALGAGLVAVAMLSGHWLLLPLIGIIYVAEAFSVMLQVSYFKYTRRKYGEGRRILRMAPLHHHFEQLGMSEVQITLRFWIVAAVAAAAGVALGLGH